VGVKVQADTVDLKCTPAIGWQLVRWHARFRMSFQIPIPIIVPACALACVFQNEFPNSKLVTCASNILPDFNLVRACSDESIDKNI
jgi:hypothetical protein